MNKPLNTPKKKQRRAEMIGRPLQFVGAVFSVVFISQCADVYRLESAKHATLTDKALLYLTTEVCRPVNTRSNVP